MGYLKVWASPLGMAVLASAGASAIFCWLTGGAPHAFLWDDNLTQWYGVSRYGFDALLEGHAPHWNPYQWAGMRIDSVGYYGQFNPLLFAAYLLERCCRWDMMTLYGALMHALGVCGACALARQAGVGRTVALMLGWLYGMTPGPFVQANWYFLWNAFAAMPPMLGCVRAGLHAPGETRYAAVALGLGAACMLYLGNAQYAAYSMVVCLGLAWAEAGWQAGLGRKAGGGPAVPWFCAWTLTWLGLGSCAAAAAPAVWAGRQAAADLIFSGGATTLAVPLRTLALATLLPWRLAHRAAPGGPYYVYLSSMPGLAAVALTAAVAQLHRRRMRSASACTAWAGLCTAGGIAALGAGCVLVEHIVWLNRFRYAFKWLFMLPPVALYVAACAISPLGRRQALGLSACGLALAGANLTQVPLHPPSPFAVQAERQAVSNAAPRYRTATVQDRGLGRPDDGQREWLAQLMGNGCTYQQLPCLQGYDLCLAPAWRADMQQLFGDFWWFGAPLRAATFAPAQSGAMAQTQSFCRLLADYGVGTLRLFGGEGQTLGLNDTPACAAGPPAAPLVADAQGRALDARLHAEGIVIPDVSAAAGRVTARYWPLPGFRAELHTADGSRRAVPLQPGRFLQADVDAAGTLHFVLVDRAATLALATGWLVTAAFVATWCVVMHRLRPTGGQRAAAAAVLQANCANPHV
jgi:hypothetical protein